MTIHLDSRVRVALTIAAAIAAAVVGFAGLPDWATALAGVILTVTAALGIIPPSLNPVMGRIYAPLARSEVRSMQREVDRRAAARAMDTRPPILGPGNTVKSALYAPKTKTKDTP